MHAFLFPAKQIQNVLFGNPPLFEVTSGGLGCGHGHRSSVGPPKPCFKMKYLLTVYKPSCHIWHLPFQDNQCSMTRSLLTVHLMNANRLGSVFVHSNRLSRKFSLVNIEIKWWWMQLLLCYYCSHYLLLPSSFRSNVKVFVFFLFLRTYCT